jgi:hypothetical protein
MRAPPTRRQMQDVAPCLAKAHEQRIAELRRDHGGAAGERPRVPVMGAVLSIPSHDPYERNSQPRGRPAA